MAGNMDGGAKAGKTNKERYGDDYYARIGALGGHKGRTGGFASEKVGADGLTGRERARKAGSVGGYISRRGVSKGIRRFELYYEDTPPQIIEVKKISKE